MSLDVVSLGCRLNLAESESLRAMLSGSRDLVVINSCAVTAEAVRQTRQAIRRARKARPDARLLVTGWNAMRSPPCPRSMGWSRTPPSSIRAPGTRRR
jgi:tRNA A37 methylthiotransferase MiaB